MRREHRGRRQADEVEQPGAAGELVEVVDAPATDLVLVAPGAVVLDMEVADERHGDVAGERVRSTSVAARTSQR